MHIPDQESRGHVSPVRTYLIIGSLLLVLTVITVAAAQVDWGTKIGGGFALNVTIAMIIATIKATLVLMYFMHMKYESKLVWGFGIVYPIIIFGILILLASLDIFKRDVPKGLDSETRLEQQFQAPTEKLARR